MSGTDPELERWMAEWRAGEGPDGQAHPGGNVPAALRRRVRRRSLGLVLMTIGEVVVTVTAMVVLWWVAESLGTRFDAFTLTTLSVLAGLALAFSLWNRCGIWRPSLESTSAYLDLSVARCARHRRGLRMGWCLLIAEIALYIPWIWHRLYADPINPPYAGAFLASYGFLAAIGGLGALILWNLGRRAKSEAEALDALRRSLLDPDGEGG